MARSPIEMMIDKGCGLEIGWELKIPPSDLVTLCCPICKKEKMVDREDHDLPGTVVVEVYCRDCPMDGFEEVHCYRLDGTEILDGQ